MNKPRRAPRRRVDGVLLLDKPAGITSNAALQKARWLFNAAKAGHTGTLDPMATGLLPLCFGEATKFAGELLDADKSYRATLRFGVTTDTADADGRVLTTRPVAVTDAQWRAAVADFCGEIEQVPPMHSALKRDGKPLYEYARAGIKVERQPRRVTIHRIETASFAGDEATIDVDCSKGTYIRTLAADIGERLGCGAHLIALRRTRIGECALAEAVTVAEIENRPSEQRYEVLRAVDYLLAELPVLTLDNATARDFALGRQIPGPALLDQRVRIYSDAGFLGIGEGDGRGRIHPKRVVKSRDQG